MVVLARRSRGRDGDVITGLARQLAVLPHVGRPPAVVAGGERPPEAVPVVVAARAATEAARLPARLLHELVGLAVVHGGGRPRGAEH